jgi:hypothetical protein
MEVLVNSARRKRNVEILLPELFPAAKTKLRFLDGGERAGIEALGGVLYKGVADGLRELLSGGCSW